MIDRSRLPIPGTELPEAVSEIAGRVAWCADRFDITVE
jgi:hypothetical protein